jgi:hypothetical protein
MLYRFVVMGAVSGVDYKGRRTHRKHDVMGCAVMCVNETMSWARCQAVNYHGMWHLDVPEIMCDVFFVWYRGVRAWTRCHGVRSERPLS